MLSEQFLRPEGLLSEILPGFEPRPQQTELCDFIEKNLANQQHCITEAGTGIGKSFAYLIPSIMFAHENECKVIISTKTIALQNQILNKDIPVLQKAFALKGITFSCALGKGRRNYACINKYRRTAQTSLFNNPLVSGQHDDFSRWIINTETGDRSEINFPADNIWPEMCSDRLDCLERKCPDFSRCFLQKQRIKLNQSDILVVNHSLLFSDLAVRRSCGKTVLPDCQVVVMDEAHHLEETAQNNLGTRLNIFDFKRLYVKTEQKSEGLWSKLEQEPEINQLITEFNRNCNAKAQKLFEQADTILSGQRNHRFRQPLLQSELPSDMLNYLRTLQNLALSVNLTEEEHGELDLYCENLQEIRLALEEILELSSQPQSVYWAEKHGNVVSLNSTPLNLDQILQELWEERTFIFTSATLSINGSFDNYAAALGLEEYNSLVLGSPFNYRDNVLLLIPSSSIEPRQNDSYNRYLADKITEILSITQGQTLVLFTSIRQMQEIFELTSQIICHQLGLNLIVQSGTSRENLINDFISGPPSVLFGLDTFWEGIDIPGPALNCIIITKLPFPAPGAPIIEARSELIRDGGGNPFVELSLPKAIVKFKQGFGRLIRTTSDRGIVVVLDDRLTRKNYKQAFLNSIPLTKRSRSIKDISQFLFPDQ